MTLDVRLLGQLAVIRDGHRLELRSRPAQMLLAYLVLHTGQSIAREKIAGLLWPDSTKSVALKNLRQALWRLRRVIGNDQLVVNTRSLRLKTESVTSDVARLRGADSTNDSESLASSVEHYGGELLPGHYADWIQEATGRLRATFDRRMARLLEILVEQERWEEVRDWAELWIDHRLVPETAHRALMRAHAGLGNVAGVTNAYRRCLEALQKELGAAPSHETRALYRRLAPRQAVSAARGTAGPRAAVAMPAVRIEGSWALLEAKLVIDRAPGEVSRTMLDPEQVPLVRSTVLEYEVVVGAPGKVGTRVRAVKKMGTDILEFHAVAIAAEEGRWLKSAIHSSRLDLEFETRWDQVTAGTLVTHSRRFEIPENFYGGLEPGVSLQLYATELRSDLENLKFLLESR